MVSTWKIQETHQVTSPQTLKEQLVFFIFCSPIQLCHPWGRKNGQHPWRYRTNTHKKVQKKMRERVRKHLGTFLSDKLLSFMAEGEDLGVDLQLHRSSSPTSHNISVYSPFHNLTRFLLKSVKWAVPVSLLYGNHSQVEPALGQQPNPVRNVNWKGLEI